MSYPGPGSNWGTPEDGQNAGQQPDPNGGYGNSDATTHYSPYGEQGGGQYGESGTSAYGSGQYGNQPGQPGQSGPYGDPGQSGQYGAGQPGAYPPAGGGGYGGGTPPQPPYGGTPAAGSGGSGNNRMPLIIGIVVALLVAGGLIAFLVTRGGNDKKNNAETPPPSRPSSQVVTDTSSFPTDETDSGPTDGGSSAPSGISETDARDTVNQYLDDINSQDATDAATLICASESATWQATIDRRQQRWGLHHRGRHQDDQGRHADVRRRRRWSTTITAAGPQRRRSQADRRHLRDHRRERSEDLRREDLIPFRRDSDDVRTAPPAPGVGALRLSARVSPTRRSCSRRWPASPTPPFRRLCREAMATRLAPGHARRAVRQRDDHLAGAGRAQPEDAAADRASSRTSSPAACSSTASTRPSSAPRCA